MNLDLETSLDDVSALTHDDQLAISTDPVAASGEDSDTAASQDPAAEVPVVEELVAEEPVAVEEPVVEDPTVADATARGPFEDVPVRLRAALEARGFSELTAVQRAVLEAEVEGRDLQISSQTGSGKTVALGFVLTPRLEAERTGDGPDALIIVPTRELAAQVCKELGWLLHDVPGARVVAVTGGSPIYRDRKVLARHPRVLVGTPGRLLDHVSNKALDLSNVRELVLDEADQMLDLGFRDELEGLLDATPTTRRTHLVSATFPDGIQRLAARYQREPVAIEGTRLGDANEDIEHRGYLVQPRDRYDALVNLLLLSEGERTLVFVERRSDALEVAERLEADGFAALPLSGELAQSQRERTLAAFRAGRTLVLVATDVAARGLDVPDVATVIHTAPPMDAQVYTHRSGRTGRAGKQGASVLFAPPHRRRKVDRLLSEAGLNMRWGPVPRADEVRSQLEERARTKMKTQLDAALAEGPPAAQRAQAEQLLEGRDAADVVAALLTRLEPAQRAEPRDVESAQVREERPFKDRGPRHDRGGRPTHGAPHERGARPQRSGSYERSGPQERGGSYERSGSYERGPQRDRGASNGGGPASFERGGRYERGRDSSQRQEHGRREHGPRRGRFEGNEAVRFFVNWGINQGATPGRLLAALCRRGEVTGSHIGSIAVHPNASTFDVHASVAEQFERLAGRRDPRDPQTLIRRDRGPRQTAPRPRR